MVQMDSEVYRYQPLCLLCFEYTRKDRYIYCYCFEQVDYDEKEEFYKWHVENNIEVHNMLARSTIFLNNLAIPPELTDHAECCKSAAPPSCLFPLVKESATNLGAKWVRELQYVLELYNTLGQSKYFHQISDVLKFVLYPYFSPLGTDLNWYTSKQYGEFTQGTGKWVCMVYYNDFVVVQEIKTLSQNIDLYGFDLKYEHLVFDGHVPLSFNVAFVHETFDVHKFEDRSLIYFDTPPQKFEALEQLEQLARFARYE